MFFCHVEVPPYDEPIIKWSGRAGRVVGWALGVAFTMGLIAGAVWLLD